MTDRGPDDEIVTISVTFRANPNQARFAEAVDEIAARCHAQLEGLQDDYGVEHYTSVFTDLHTRRVPVGSSQITLDLAGVIDLGASLGSYQRVKALAREVFAEQHNAWNETAAAHIRGDDLSGAYQRGRAHALCRVLGDQERLTRLGIFD